MKKYNDTDMKMYKLLLLCLFVPVLAFGQKWKLVWSEEFNYKGKPDAKFWSFEKGFARNEELQWYQDENAYCKKGVLVIEARKEKVLNPEYKKGDVNWKTSREYAEYTSSSINTEGKKDFLYGRVEVRAKIPTACGAWPAIWTLGKDMEWPLSGEVDLMEFYQINNVPSILANAAWGTNVRWKAKWDGANKPLSHFTEKDRNWANKFHIWRMDWDKDFIRLYLDNELLNEIDISKTINPDGTNPFHQPQYLLLNLAIGRNGGDPSQTKFPLVYEIDYVRIYQQN